MVEQFNLVLARWQRLLLSLLTIILGIFALTLAGAALETSWRAAAGKQAATRGALVLRPRQGSGATLLAAATRLPGVAGVAGCLNIAYTDSLLQEAHWQSARLWAVRTDVDAWRFVPPVSGLRLAAGHYPEAPGQALVGYELAQVLHLNIGSTVWLQERAFTVAGIWQPAGFEAGNFVQVPYEVAAALAPGAGDALDPLYVLLAPGQDPQAARRELAARLEGAVALMPAEFWAEERQVLRALALLVASLAALVALVSGPAAVHALRPLRGPRHEAALVAGLVGALAGAFGLCLGWGAALWLNADLGRAYAITPLTVTPRLALSAMAWPAVSGALYGLVALRRRAGELGRLARGAVATGAIAATVLVWLLVGSLEESLALALARTRALNANRLGLEARGRLLGDAIVGQAGLLPGCQGLIVEAEGGALVEGEKGWPGRPPSGLVAGLLSADGQTGLSVPYPVRLREGRALEGPGEVIVGAELARSRRLALGDVLNIRGRDFTVVGIRERWPYDALSPVNYRADVTLEALRSLLGAPALTGQVTLLVPPVGDEAQRTAYLAKAQQQVPDMTIADTDAQLARVAAGYPGGRTLTAEKPVEHTQGLYYRLFLAATALACALSGLTVAIALYPVYLEQRIEVGVQKLVGATPGHILAGFLWDALAIAGLGLALGAYAASLWTAALNACFHGSPAWVPLALTPRLLAAVGLLTLGGGVLFALGPGLQAAAVDPAVVLTIRE